MNASPEAGPSGLHPAVRALLDIGPVIAFLVTYLALSDRTFQIGSSEIGALVVVSAGFVPVFALAGGTLWLMEGRVARIQLVTFAALAVFALLSLWFNDPALIKMKPTFLYAALGTVLLIGLLRGKSWLRYVMEDVLPLKKRGWKILTRRVTALCFVSAAANELVWRTQPENVWVLFETLIMPVVVLLFFVAQIGLFVEHTALGGAGKTSPRRAVK